MPAELKHFHDRLAKIGIYLHLVSNSPWVYLHSVNGKIVTELSGSEHGFVLGFLPISLGQSFRFSDLRKTFKLIREYNGK